MLSPEVLRKLEAIEQRFEELTHQLSDPAAGRVGAMAVGRARAAAERLPPTLRDPALRWAAAQERAIEALNALAGAPASEGPALARRYHAAKADALAALADYFAALAAR